jgi:hypothetical protein
MNAKEGMSLKEFLEDFSFDKTTRLFASSTQTRRSRSPSLQAEDTGHKTRSFSSLLVSIS